MSKREEIRRELCAAEDRLDVAYGEGLPERELEGLEAMVAKLDRLLRRVAFEGSAA